MCVVWKHLCLARCRDAWYAHGRQRDSSPAGADVLAPTCVGVFFMAGCTGHKKDPISFEAGLAPLELPPAALYLLPCSILLAVETKQFCPVAPTIKKTRSHSRWASPPRAPPAALYLLPRRILLAVEPKQFYPVAPAIKKTRSHSRRASPPRAPPAALYHLCFHHNRRTDSKKSTLPRQSALRLGCSVLAGWCRIRQPSSPWPALRAPCCPR